MTGSNPGYSVGERAILHKLKNALNVLQVDEDEVWDAYMKYKENLEKLSNTALVQTVRTVARDNGISIQGRIEKAVEVVLE